MRSRRCRGNWEVDTGKLGPPHWKEHWGQALSPRTQGWGKPGRANTAWNGKTCENQRALEPIQPGERRMPGFQRKALLASGFAFQSKSPNMDTWEHFKVLKVEGGVGIPRQRFP